MAAIVSKVRGSSARDAVELSAPAAERRRVRLVRLSAALLLMIISGVLGWVAFQARGETIEVWVARSGIDPGAVIVEGDLFQETIDANSPLGALSIDANVIGRTVRVGVPSGAAITAQHLFAPGDSFAVPNMAQVGLVLEDGQAPEGIQVDDLLRLLLANDNVLVQEVLEEVPVLAIESTSGSELLITVELPIDRADEFALAAARGDVVATIVGRR